MSLLNRSRDDDDRMDPPPDLITEDHPGGNLEKVSPSALATITKTNLEVQIEQAMRRPRNLTMVLRDAASMATANAAVAESCLYTLPERVDYKTGKKTSIQGPSVRLAEIMLACYGNATCAARIIDDDGKMVTAQGVFIDLQRNISTSVEVKRRVTKKNGERFSDDMVVVTCNAACAIAFRNVVYKGIPNVYTMQVYEQAKQVAIGDAMTLVTRRERMLAAFGKMGINQERVFAAVNAKSEQDIGLDELVTLKGLANAVKEGDISADEAFPPISPMEQRPAAADAKPEEKPTTKRKAKAAEPEPAPAPAPSPSPLAFQQLNSVGEIRRLLVERELDEADALAVLRDNSQGDAWLKPTGLLGDLEQWQIDELIQKFAGFAKAVAAYIAQRQAKAKPAADDDEHLAFN